MADQLGSTMFQLAVVNVVPFDHQVIQLDHRYQFDLALVLESFAQPSVLERVMERMSEA